MPAFDLDAYLERISCPDARGSSLDTLAALQRHHTRAIPFENLNPLMGWPVRLDAGTLQQKLVRERRGGYCYEQNLLFGHALTALGFRWRGLAARVQWNVPTDTPRPRTHILIEVEIGDVAYLADVGFGGVTLTAPLRFVPDREQTTPHETFRIVREAEGFVLQTRIGTVWRALYAFSTESYLLPDFEMANWFVSTHPQSIFRNSLMVARADEGRRYTVLNGQMAVHHVGRDSEHRVLGTVGELREVLSGPFGIQLPDTPALDEVLARVLSPATQP